MNLLLALVLSIALSIFAWGQDVTPEVEEIKLSGGDIKDYFKEFGVNKGNYGPNALETQGSSYLEIFICQGHGFTHLASNFEDGEGLRHAFHGFYPKGARLPQSQDDSSQNGLFEIFPDTNKLSPWLLFLPNVFYGFKTLFYDEHLARLENEWNAYGASHVPYQSDWRQSKQYPLGVRVFDQCQSIKKELNQAQVKKIIHFIMTLKKEITRGSVNYQGFFDNCLGFVQKVYERVSKGHFLHEFIEQRQHLLLDNIGMVYSHYKAYGLASFLAAYYDYSYGNLDGRLIKSDLIPKTFHPREIDKFLSETNYELKDVEEKAKEILRKGYFHVPARCYLAVYDPYDIHLIKQHGNTEGLHPTFLKIMKDMEGLNDSEIGKYFRIDEQGRDDCSHFVHPSGIKRQRFIEERIARIYKFKQTLIEGFKAAWNALEDKNQHRKALQIVKSTFKYFPSLKQDVDSKPLPMDELIKVYGFEKEYEDLPLRNQYHHLMEYLLSFQDRFQEFLDSELELEALALHLIHQSSIKQKHEILSNDPRLYNPLMIGDTQIYFVGSD